MHIAIAVVYTLSLLYIFLFSIGQLHLTYIYRKTKKKTPTSNADFLFTPLVTVQLPIYNEKYVVERLIDAIAQLDYPKHKIEIQLLDDSTDETTKIILEKIEAIKLLGLNFKLIHREHRVGYKAGALDHGTQLASGEFIAIFDADFIPPPDFLRTTLPYFANEKVGAVQTRWGHLNREYSILTQLQAFGLDAHFSIEQTARSAAGSFINFNGTCGVWRKKCIDDAGGWSNDTLTEDLDLSYRAQLKGWKFEYLEEIETKGELPMVMSAIKSQQYRWNKGAAETAKKNFGNVLRSSLPWTNKAHAFFHLFNSSVFVCILIAAILSVPMLYIKSQHSEFNWLFNLAVFFLVGFLSISWFYWVATTRFNKLDNRRVFWTLYPRFLIMSMGLSLHNGLAVIEGLIGRKTPFIRTPKFNIVKGDSWKFNSYVNTKLNLLTLLEGAFCLYFVFGIVAGIRLHDVGLLFFHAMLALGFGGVFYYSIKSSLHG